MSSEDEEVEVEVVHDDLVAYFKDRQYRPQAVLSASVSLMLTTASYMEIDRERLLHIIDVAYQMRGEAEQAIAEEEEIQQFTEQTEGIMLAPESDKIH